jgi:hypothetical protein
MKLDLSCAKWLYSKLGNIAYFNLKASGKRLIIKQLSLTGITTIGARFSKIGTVYSCNEGY